MSELADGLAIGSCGVPTLPLLGGVPELADGPDLGSGVARRGGSSPPFPTFTIVIVFFFSVFKLNARSFHGKGECDKIPRA